MTYPSSCELTIAVMYVPGPGRRRRLGVGVRAEVAGVDPRRVRPRDDWLAEHPPAIEWWPNAVMPMEIDAGEPIVETLLDASADPAGAGARRPGLLVRRRDLHPAGRHPVGRLRTAGVRPRRRHRRPHDRRVRAGRWTGRLRPGAGGGGDAVLRGRLIARRPALPWAVLAMGRHGGAEEARAGRDRPWASKRTYVSFSRPGSPAGAAAPDRLGPPGSPSGNLAS